MIKKNNKAQVGLTITWFLAFIMIAIFIVLFIVLTLSIVKTKKILSFGMWKNEILMQDNATNSEVQRELVLILNTPIENEKNLEQLIIEWKLGNSEIKPKIEKNLKEILDKTMEKKSCYYFSINPNSEDYIWIDNKLNKDYVHRIGNSFLVSGKTSELMLFVNNQKIKITLFVGKC